MGIIHIFEDVSAQHLAEGELLECRGVEGCPLQDSFEAEFIDFRVF